CCVGAQRADIRAAGLRCACGVAYDERLLTWIAAMGLSITYDEVNKIEHALKAWFESQHLNPHDGAYVMAHMAGLIVGMESNDEEHMREGLKTLNITMTNLAERMLKTRDDP